MARTWNYKDPVTIAFFASYQTAEPSTAIAMSLLGALGPPHASQLLAAALRGVQARDVCGKRSSVQSGVTGVCTVCT